MKVPVLVGLATAFVMYALYTQRQISDIQASLLASQPIEQRSVVFDGGAYIPVVMPARAKPDVDSSATPVEINSVATESSAVKNIGEVFPTGPLVVKSSLATVPRSIGEVNFIENMSPRPESVAEPRNIGEFIPVDIANSRL